MIKRYRRVSLSQYLVVFLAILIAAGLGFLGTVVMRQQPFEDHFVIPWSAGRLWLLEGLNPYDDEALQLAERTVAGSAYQAQVPADVPGLTEPLLNLIFTIPFSLLPYGFARALWVTIMMVVIGLIAHFAVNLARWKVSLPERTGIILLVLAWFPSIQSTVMGGLSPVTILLLVVGLLAIVRGQDTLAGFMFALSFGSIQTSLFVLVFIFIWSISTKRRPILVAFFSGLAFLWAVTLILLPSWPMDWLGALLRTYADFSWVHTPLMDLAALLPGISSYLSIALHAGFGIYTITLWITALGESGRVFIWKALALMVAAYLFHVQSGTEQLFLILPALFMVFRFMSERWSLFGRLFSWALLMLISVGSWFLAAPQFAFDSTHRFGLLVAGLPVLTFLGMIWIRWWAIKIPRLPFDEA
ncbi:MAG: glycosyltransferase family 87 protein [Chloroflexota bacterium]|nr:glycosyltransferase family 87 protein [Chloroflexota bacterium]